MKLYAVLVRLEVEAENEEDARRNWYQSCSQRELVTVEDVSEIPTEDWPYDWDGYGSGSD